MKTAENKKWETIKKQIYRFSTLTAAKAFADRCEKIHMIVLGDNDEYWVGLPATTEWLGKNGHEYAN